MVLLGMPQVFWDKYLGRRHRWIPFLPLEFPGGFESMMPTRDELGTKQGRCASRRLLPSI